MHIPYTVVARQPGQWYGRDISQESSFEEAVNTIEAVAREFPEGTLLFMYGPDVKPYRGKGVYRVDDSGEAVKSRWVSPKEDPEAMSKKQSRKVYLDDLGVRRQDLRGEFAELLGEDQPFVGDWSVKNLARNIEELKSEGSTEVSFRAGPAYSRKVKVDIPRAKELIRRARELEKHTPLWCFGVVGPEEGRKALSDEDKEGLESLLSLRGLLEDREETREREVIQARKKTVREAFPDVENLEIY